MRYLILIFLVCCLVLPVMMWVQSEAPVPFPDGRLLAAPMPPPVAPPEPPLLAPREAEPLPAHAAPDTGSPRLEIVGMAPEEPVVPAAVVPRLRLSDPSGWGIPRTAEPAPVPMAAVVEPRPFENVSAPPDASSGPQSTAPLIASVLPREPLPSEPNLYLPEGALNEAGALLTLIKPELGVHRLPDPSSEAAPFVLKEGDQVRPLTRLRSEKDFDWIKFRRDGGEWWAQAEYFIRVDPRNRTADGKGNLEIGKEAVDRNSALPLDYCPDDLVPVERDVTLDDREIRLRREVAEAFVRMARAAREAGLQVRVFSGYRDFNYQKRLYLEAIETRGPKQNGVAAPGYSEHQLGTTVDVSGLDRRYLLRGDFAETPEGKWLAENAERFGFRHSYTQENMDESGYKPEPWHLRYVGTAGANGTRGTIARGK